MHGSLQKEGLKIWQSALANMKQKFGSTRSEYTSGVFVLSQVTQWAVGPLGLLYDRLWMVVNINGVCLSQKQEPRLCLIQPSIHWACKELCLHATGKPCYCGNTLERQQHKELQYL